MKNPTLSSRVYTLLFAAYLVFPLFNFQCTKQKKGIYPNEDSIVLINRHAEYAVGRDGRNKSIRYKGDPKNYFDESGPLDFMRIYRGEKHYPSTSVGFADGLLTVGFEGSGVTASVIITVEDDWFILELTGISGEADSLRLANLGLNIREHLGAIINACYNDEFAVCVQALDFNVNSCPQDSKGNSLFPADFVEAGQQFLEKGVDSRILTATVYPSLPIEGNPRVAIIACPGKRLSETIGRLETACSLPHPTLAGEWGKVSPEVEISYLFMDYTQDNVDEVIRYARAAGFGYLVTHPFTTGGHYLIDSLKFPGGLAGLKKAVAKIHAAGLKAGLHSNTGGISANDPYVTPVPDSRLAKSEVFELAQDIDNRSTQIPVLTSPRGLVTRHGYRLYGPGLHLQIDDEIIKYGNYTTEPPYTFTECVRGAHGTAVARHRKDAKVYHLAEKWRHFVVDVHSSMLEEVSRRLAQIINNCEFDWLYLDGAEILSAQGPGFYYVNRFVYDLFSRFNRDVLIQSSYCDNLTMHVVSRVTSNDFPFYSIRKYLEISRLDCIKLYNDNFCPAEFGWWGLILNNDNHYSTLPEEIEYGCAKTIAYDQAISLQASKHNLEGHGRTEELLEIFKRYEILRRQNYFSGRIKDQLKDPAYDYKLFQDRDGKWLFRKIKYGPDYYVQGSGSGTWTHENEFDSQPLSVRIRCAYSPAGYDDPQNVSLITPEDVRNTEFATGGDLTGSISVEKNKSIDEPSVIKLQALNRSAETSSWCRFHLNYAKNQDLSRNRMVGAWVYGDGSGALLNFHLGTPRGLTIDHYVDLDFKGWKYFEITRPEGDRVFDYKWPYLWKHSLLSLRWREVDKFAVYFNAVPPNTEVTCFLRPVKALKTVENTLNNPSITINGRTITFPGQLKQDEYLEFTDSRTCRFYGPDGHLLNEVEPVGPVPEVSAGENEVTFDCDSGNIGQRSAIVTIITLGKVLSE
ncbi:hypothetical protein ACFL5K_00025 [Gemmatimonadota bacterium]